VAKSSNWKAVERAVAKYLGGERIPITGRVRDNGLPDIKHDVFSIEVKHRKSAIPDWLLDAMDQAIKSKDTEKHIPIVILHKKGVKYEDSIVLLTLKDLKALYKNVT
jgi:hypothetical protein